MEPRKAVQYSGKLCTGSPFLNRSQAVYDRSRKFFGFPDETPDDEGSQAQARPLTPFTKPASPIREYSLGQAAPPVGPWVFFEVPVSVATRLLLASCLVLTSCVLQAQSYQSAFSEVQVDRVATPATYHGGVSVDAPSGAASMDIPFGPGLGARNIHFVPTLNMRVAPQLGVSCQDVWYSEYVGTTLMPMNENIDGLYQRTYGSSTFTPGTFDLGLVDNAGTGGFPNQSTFTFQGGGGTVLGTVPSGMTPSAAQALITTFGLTDQLGYLPGNCSPTRTTPFIQMGSGGQVILGLRSAGRLSVPASDQYYPAQLTDEVCTPLNFNDQGYP